jgi:hypothetical protein
MANHRLGMGGPVADSLATEMVPGRTGEFADLVFTARNQRSHRRAPARSPMRGIPRPSPTAPRTVNSLQPRHLHKCVVEP